ncbi:hypothetical protein [Fulvitalea axinellae]|uniref:hypothetical protein n=1 Tax=Fulvitalea axinellae TaxID=1182444 RepID=UPI0030CA3CA2
MDLVHANSDSIALELQRLAHRQAVINYIERFVVPGNLGAGTVTFDGVEYVAEEVAQD